MLVVSMAVTVLTQFWTNVFNTRGRQLKGGLMDLLQQISPTLPRQLAERVSVAVLTHPLIQENGGRLGTVVHREELTKLLMELASDSGPQNLETAAKDKLIEVLKTNGVQDPAAMLSKIRQTALQIEKSNPELANNMRMNLAILQEAGGEFVAKINSWFDQTIDRVSQRFTFHARWITFLNACVVVLFLQLDTVAVVNRLSVDDALRAAMVEQAQQIYEANAPADQYQADQPGAAPPAGAQAGGTQAGGAQQVDRKYGAFLARNGLVSMPESFDAWLRAWNWHKTPGLLLSAMLLSLGAPFWFNALKNLLRLRSALANKDDSQRQERQTTQVVVTTPARPA